MTDHILIFSDHFLGENDPHSGTQELLCSCQSGKTRNTDGILQTLLQKVVHAPNSLPHGVYQTHGCTDVPGLRPPGNPLAPVFTELRVYGKLTANYCHRILD